MMAGESGIGAEESAVAEAPATGIATTRRGGMIAVDAHVHFHDDRLIPATLDAAAVNFSSIESPARPSLGMLLLAESSAEQSFDLLTNSDRVGAWQLQSLPGERESIIATKGASRIAIICGQQVRCVHGIEILALGSRRRYPERCQPDDVVNQAIADGAVPVVPWGFGKWMGRSGVIVKALFDNRRKRSLFVGDNGGRLAMVGRPPLLKRLQRDGARVLPGSDPFPFGGDYRRVGGFGFLADAPISVDQPWAMLRTWLLTGSTEPIPYGRAVGPVRFLRNQTGIQIHNRLQRAARK